MELDDPSSQRAGVHILPVVLILATVTMVFLSDRLWYYLTAWVFSFVCTIWLLNNVIDLPPTRGSGMPGIVFPPTFNAGIHLLVLIIAQLHIWAIVKVIKFVSGKTKGEFKL